MKAVLNGRETPHMERLLFHVNSSIFVSGHEVPLSTLVPTLHHTEIYNKETSKLKSSYLMQALQRNNLLDAADR